MEILRLLNELQQVKVISFVKKYTLPLAHQIEYWVYSTYIHYEFYINGTIMCPKTLTYLFTFLLVQQNISYLECRASGFRFVILYIGYVNYQEETHNFWTSRKLAFLNCFVPHVFRWLDLSLFLVSRIHYMAEPTMMLLDINVGPSSAADCRE